MDDATEALPLEHQVERLVNFREFNAVGYELLYFQLLHNMHDMMIFRQKFGETRFDWDFVYTIQLLCS